MALTKLGFETKTASGAITVPDGCDFITAVVIGSVNPPAINAISMETKATVAAQGVLQALSIHVLPVSLNIVMPFVFDGTLVTFYYFENGVCARPTNVKGYNAAGSVTGTHVTTTGEIMLGVVLGNNGQVTLTADSSSFTFDVDQMTYRIGYKIPGDTSQAIVAADPGTLSSYWYNPPAIWHDTTTTVLVTPGHYETTQVYHQYRSVYSHYSAPNYVYINGIYSDPGDPNYSAGFVPQGGISNFQTYQGTVIYGSSFYTYPQVWVPPVYEEQASGYWEYPAPVEIVTGTPGYVSTIVVSISDVMIGSVYTSRPLIA